MEVRILCPESQPDLGSLVAIIEELGDTSSIRNKPLGPHEIDVWHNDIFKGRAVVIFITATADTNTHDWWHLLVSYRVLSNLCEQTGQQAALGFIRVPDSVDTIYKDFNEMPTISLTDVDALIQLVDNLQSGPPAQAE
jgi:hypothetical protein